MIGIQLGAPVRAVAGVAAAALLAACGPDSAPAAQHAAAHTTPTTLAEGRR